MLLNVASKPGRVPAATAIFADLFLLIKFLAVSPSCLDTLNEFCCNLD